MHIQFIVFILLFFTTRCFAIAFTSAPLVHYSLMYPQRYAEIGKSISLHWKIETSDAVNIHRGVLTVYRFSSIGGLSYWKAIPASLILTVDNCSFTPDVLYTENSPNSTQGIFSITLNEEGNYYFMLTPENGTVAFTSKAVQVVTKYSPNKSSHPNAKGMFTWKCNLLGNEVQTIISWKGTQNGHFPFFYMDPHIIRQRQVLKKHYLSNGSFGGDRILMPSEAVVLGKTNIQNLSTVKAIIPAVPKLFFEGDLSVLPLIRDDKEMK